jgi:hypothetical protein
LPPNSGKYIPPTIFKVFYFPARPDPDLTRKNPDPRGYFKNYGWIL